MEKSWTDQPDVVENAKLITNVRLHNGIRAEIRKDSEGVYYVTFGNLFGSQTLRAEDADAAIRALGVTSYGLEGRPTDPPTGTVLLEGKK